MLNDFSLAIDTQNSFYKFLSSYQEGVEGKIDMDEVKEGGGESNQPLIDYLAEWGEMEVKVKVLTAGYWPSYPTIDLNLPHEMGLAIKVNHKKYFLSLFSHTFYFIFKGI